MGKTENFKILAVDDDPVILAYYSTMLSKAGYKVEIAAEATGAIMLFKEAPADLLLLDVAMPSGGGRQVFEVVSGLVEKGVPVIFVTGLPEKIEPWVSGYANVRVMKKPVVTRELLNAISALLGAAR
jgi:DNA-binding response OmpR family regulator